MASDSLKATLPSLQSTKVLREAIPITENEGEKKFPLFARNDPHYASLSRCLRHNAVHARLTSNCPLPFRFVEKVARSSSVLFCGSIPSVRYGGFWQRQVPSEQMWFVQPHGEETVVYPGRATRDSRMLQLTHPGLLPIMQTDCY